MFAGHPMPVIGLCILSFKVMLCQSEVSVFCDCRSPYANQRYLCFVIVGHAMPIRGLCFVIVGHPMPIRGLCFVIVGHAMPIRGICVL